MHYFFHVIILLLKLLMRVGMYFTKEKTNYLIVPSHIISDSKLENICSIFHIIPSIACSIILGVKVLPTIWPYYAEQLEKNGEIITAVVGITFIPIAIVNGILLDKVLSRVNPKYSAFRKSLNEEDNIFP